MTKAERMQAREILAKMTPGEWYWPHDQAIYTNGPGVVRYGRQVPQVVEAICDWDGVPKIDCSKDDMDGIAYLRNNFAASLDALDALATLAAPVVPEEVHLAALDWSMGGQSHSYAQRMAKFILSLGGHQR